MPVKNGIDLHKVTPVVSSYSSLCLGTLNIQSILNKSCDIVDLITDRALDVLALTETWHQYTADMTIKRAVPSGYSLHDMPRVVPDVTANHINHGGLALVYRSALNLRRKTTNFVPTTFELLMCSSNTTGPSLLYVVIYRPGSSPPSNSFFDELTNLFETIITMKSDLVIMGDFNIHVDDSSNQYGHRLLDLLDLLGLVQHVDKPTQIRGHTLDLVISRNDMPISNLSIDPPFYSDHALVSFSLQLPLTKQCHGTITKLTRNLNRIDAQRLKMDIQSSAIGLHGLTTDKSVQYLFDLYHTALSHIMNTHAPITPIVMKDCPLSPWFDGDCHAARRTARRLERRYRHSLSPADRDLWLQHLNIKRDLLRDKERSYWHDKIAACTGNSREIWRRLNSLFLRDSTAAHCTSDPSANDLLAFFMDKIKLIRAASEHAKQPVYRHLAFTTFENFTDCSVETLRKVILESPSKSCLLDPIPTAILKDNLHELLPYLALMCKASLNTGILPASQKHAIITPIVKKPGLDPSSVSNYRPISNLTFMSKVIERIVASQLTSYLNINRLWPPTQSAYRNGYSTESALLRVTSDIFEACDASKVTLLALLDLSAAFDCVDHTILLERLRLTYGICGTVLEWIKSFLTDRTQTVSFAGFMSNTVKLSCGVPQGSVLGPILFLLYTADVLEIAAKYNISIHCYADDIQLYIHCNSDDTASAVTRMLKCIADIEKWMLTNRLKLNPDKSQFTWLGTWQQLRKFVAQPIVMSSGVTITPALSVRNLGCIFDPRLSMEGHINNIVSGCMLQLRQLRSVRRSLSDQAAALLVHAFVTSRLDYCNTILYGVSDRVLHKLQLVQNAAARLIVKNNHYDHITPVLRDQLHWLPIRQRIIYKIAVYVYRYFHGNLPSYLSEMLAPLSATSGRTGLRSVSHSDLKLINTNLRIGQRSFRFSGAYVWNSLPQHLRDPLLSPNAFKCRLKTHLFHVAFN